MKGPGNFVTAADHRSEETLFRELSKARPGYGFLMEERGAVEGPDKTHRWIVDPLDGTTNFLHGIPLFCHRHRLGARGRDGARLIYNPILDEMYTAEKGKGAFVNSRRLRVAARKTLADSVIATGIPHRGRDGHQRFLSECKVLMGHVAGIRRTGSAAIDLAWVAAGRFDGYVEHDLGRLGHRGGHPAGARGRRRRHRRRRRTAMFETGSIVAANPAIHKALLGVLAEATRPRPKSALAACRRWPTADSLQTGMKLPVCDASVFG